MEKKAKKIEEGRIADLTKHLQPLIKIEGTIQFEQNPIVRFMLDAGGLDLNQLYALPGIDVKHWEQFYSLIGYTLTGFGEVNFFRDEVVEAADARAEMEGLI